MTSPLKWRKKEGKSITDLEKKKRSRNKKLIKASKNDPEN